MRVCAWVCGYHLIKRSQLNGARWAKNEGYSGMQRYVHVCFLAFTTRWVPKYSYYEQNEDIFVIKGHFGWSQQLDCLRVKIWIRLNCVKVGELQ